MNELNAIAETRTEQDSQSSGDFGISDNMLESILRGLPQGATVLDVGCDGWTIHAMAQAIGRSDIKHIGADLGSEAPPRQPNGTTYIPIPKDGQTFAEQVADLTVSRHCLEHSAKPLESFEALVRATRPSCLIYVECPSELSCIPWSANDPRGHTFDNFWDDPTHVRPWPPAALYRLAISFGARPLKCGRLSRWDIPCSALLARTPKSVRSYRFVSMKDVAWGVDDAMNTFWTEE
jgi:SAM-dependent methyltransferase